MSLCTICAHPAVGVCPLTQKHLCSSICQNINYKLIQAGGKKKKRKEEENDPNEREEEEDLEPFTQEPVSSLNPRDVIRINGIVFSLPDLYKWVIEMKRSDNPLTREEIFGAVEIAQINAAAREHYPFVVVLSSLGEQNRNIAWTTLSNFENLAFYLLKTINNVTVDTLMEFMQTKQNIKFFMFNPNQSILNLIITHDDKRILDIPDLPNPFIIFNTNMIQHTTKLEELELCIKLAKRRNKGYDMFEEQIDGIRKEIREEDERRKRIDAIREEEERKKRIDAIRKEEEERKKKPIRQKLILFINDNKYQVDREEDETLYEAFERVFYKRYKPPTGIKKLLIGEIDEDSDAGIIDRSGGFPFREDDFDILEDDKTLTVRITEDYEM